MVELMGHTVVNLQNSNSASETESVNCGTEDTPNSVSTSGGRSLLNSHQSTSGERTSKGMQKKVLNFGGTSLNSHQSTSAESTSKVPKKWTDEDAVILLLERWTSHEDEFKKGLFRHEEVWKMISEEMFDEGGYDYTAGQCENKFKDMRKNYMRIKDHNSQTGVEAKTCKYYEKMAAIFDEKPNVKPVSLASNRKRHILEKDDSGDSSVDKEKSAKKREKKRKFSKVEKKMKAWAEIMKQDSLAKREEQNRRHADNQALLNKILDSNSAFFNKLPEKL